MKVEMKRLFPGFTGKIDGMSVYHNSRLQQIVGRRKVMPKFVPSGDFMRDTFKFRDRIAISEGFIGDCRAYVKAYNSKNKRKNRAMNAWTNVLLKLMRAFVADFPQVDLVTLSRVEIWENDYPIKSLAEAIEAGYLEKVKGWDSLCETI